LQFPELSLTILIVLTSLSTALIAVWLVAQRNPQRAAQARALLKDAEKATIFLFDDQELVGATAPARKLIETGASSHTGWQRLVGALADKFPTLREDLSSLAAEGQIVLRAADRNDTTVLEAEWWDDLVRIELRDTAGQNSEVPVDRQVLDALETELSMLRSVAEHAPFLLWQESQGGEIRWANKAYLSLAKELGGAAEQNTWPPKRIFNRISLHQDAPLDNASRISLQMPGQKSELWFDCHKTLIGTETLHYAIKADAAVRAETALRDFVQTLTKTFAHLPIGLAIFDRKRQLTLFNPALTDLTMLPVDFLSSRPTLSTFLDRLRDRRMIPEPRDYKGWREHLAALESAAAGGTYEETWPLPTGRTYRITGRPHPNGAVAFQFEDITSEISLTRHFRSELETGQAVMDSLSEAIAVFSPGGPLTLSNAAYVALWGVDPGTTLGEFSAAEAVRCWSAKCEPSPVWEQIERYLNQIQGRQAWRDRVKMKDGRQLDIRLTPLAAGASLIRFDAEQAAPVSNRPEPSVAGA